MRLPSPSTDILDHFHLSMDAQRRASAVSRENALPEAQTAASKLAGSLEAHQEHHNPQGARTASASSFGSPSPAPASLASSSADCSSAMRRRSSRDEQLVEFLAKQERKCVGELCSNALRWHSPHARSGRHARGMSKRCSFGALRLLVMQAAAIGLQFARLLVLQAPSKLPSCGVAAATRT